jgi:hypothetical protein
MTSASLQQPYETRRALLLQENSEDDNITMEEYLTTTTASEIATSFQPTPLQILRKVFSVDNLSPIANIIIGELAGNEVSPQIYTLTGRGPDSVLRTLRHGASITELAVSELPGVPGRYLTLPAIPLVRAAAAAIETINMW